MPAQMRGGHNRVAEVKPRLPILNDPILAYPVLAGRAQEPASICEPLEKTALISEQILAVKVNHYRYMLQDLSRQLLKIDPPRDCFNGFLLQMQTCNVRSDLIARELTDELIDRCCILEDILSAIPMKMKPSYEKCTDQFLELELRSLQARANDLINIEQKLLPQMSQAEYDAFSSYKRDISRFRLDVIPPFKRAEKLPLARALNYSYASLRFRQQAQSLVRYLCAEISKFDLYVDAALSDADFTLACADDAQRAVEVFENLQNGIQNAQAKCYYFALKPDPKSPNYAAAIQLHLKLGRFDGKLSIYKAFLAKLASQYVGPKSEFFTRVYLLLRRYATFSGAFWAGSEQKPRIFEGSIYYIGLPPKVLQILAVSGYGVEFCSSALSNYQRAFYSAFADVEACFGSRGSVFKQSQIDAAGVAFLPNSRPFIDAFAARLSCFTAKLLVIVQSAAEEDLSELKYTACAHYVIGANEYYLASGTASFTPSYYAVGVAPLHFFCYQEALPDEVLASIRAHFDSPDGLVSAQVQVQVKVQAQVQTYSK